LLGFTGYFAGFREPIVLAGIAMLEIFDTKNVKQWFALGVSAVFAAMLGTLWMAIRVEYRRDYVNMDNFEISRSAKFRNFESLTSNYLSSDMSSVWSSADQLVDRMWTVYYPALAVERVPSQLPHTNGQIVGAAVTHILTPRVFFPNKPDLQSDSEKVRK